MKKILLLILLPLLLIPVCGYSQPDSTAFLIEINEVAPLSNNYYVITPSQIKIERKDPRKPEGEHYSQPVSPTDTKLLIKMLDSIDLSDKKDSYVDNNAPDDLREYDFSININGETKKIHVYKVKVDDLYKLVAQINIMLPDVYKIAYDEDYVMSNE